jgi:hypothetical protein
MHVYWRVIHELSWLGESLIFYDPSLKRCYEEWVKKNIDALALTDDIILENFSKVSLN